MDWLLLTLTLVTVILTVSAIRDLIVSSRTVSYRRIYIQCVARLDGVSVLLNQLRQVAEHVPDPEALKVYEGALGMMESLLVSINKVPLLPSGRELVRSLEPLVVRLEKESLKALKLFKEGSHRLAPDLQLFKKINYAPPVKGCYFCSRPYSPSEFKTLKIRIQQQRLRVYACSSCRASVKVRGTADVLFFKKAGKKVHWSEVDEYDPTTDYWTLGRRRKTYQPPNLKLISNSDKSD